MEKPVISKITNPQLLYSWKAPLRAYKKRSSGVLRFYVALSLLLSLIVFFFGEKILVLPIWAVMFLFYVFTITPPPEIENRITEFGIETANNTFRWDFLSHFYVIKKFDYHVVVVVSVAPFYYHIYLVVKDEQTLHQVVNILSRYLLYQEHPKKTFTDKIVEWLTKLMPDEVNEVKEKSTGFEKGMGVTL